MARRLVIRHIVNPLVASPKSDLSRAQPITFASLRSAADQCSETIDVEFYAAVFEEDRAAVPDWMHSVVVLERSVLDFGTFEYQRKLPLLADILAVSDQGSIPDLLVYSNIDIAVMPYFYEFLERSLRNGIDGLVINRRSIISPTAGSDDLIELYSELGQPHPGRDCFAFTPAAFAEYDLGLLAIGAGDVGRGLTWNIAIHAQEFRWLKHQHLTFHLGDARAWDRFEMAQYHDHNNDQLHEILARLEARYGPLQDRAPWNEILPRTPGYWADRRWAEEPKSALVRAQRKARRRLRRLTRF